METLSGWILTEDGISEGYVCTEDGMISSVECGKYVGTSLAKGLIVPSLVNSHTHCADGGLKIGPGMTLEELVAPPDGLKHKYLEGADDDSLKENMRDFAAESQRCGIGAFIDFREGGAHGCRLLRDAAPQAVILGRPVSKEYDPNEIADILSVADGIGISSVSDIDHRYIENIADQTRREGKIFAVHASERIREDIDLILSFDPAFVVHMTEATDSDILKCAEQDVSVVVCAGSNSYFGIVPPIKRILEKGAKIAIGTDNAMLRSPDMRSEALLFGEILKKQGGSFEDVLEPMLINGRKILYPHNKISLMNGTAADLTVLPCSDGSDAECILRNTEPIFRYRLEK